MTQFETVAVRIDGQERTGSYKKSGGTEYIYYTEKNTEKSGSGSRPGSGEDPADRVLLKISDGRMEVTRQGQIRSEMVFVPGERIRAQYATPYGTIDMETGTEQLQIARRQGMIGIHAKYQLFSGGELLSENDIKIEIVFSGGGHEMDLETKRELPVAVIDSGVGGISVLKELVKQLPGEDFLFFGDSANAPYGTKSREWICETVLGHAARYYERGIKALVVACNTATSAAIKELRAQYPQMPVIGIEPALKPAVMVKEHPHVLVLATPGTVMGEKFQNLMHGFEEQARVSALPCPGLMEFVEEGELEGPRLGSYLEKLLENYKAGEERPDAVVLGCTHYPFVRRAIRKVLGDDVPVLDGSEGTARETRRRLVEAGLLRERETGGRVTFETSLPGKELLCRALMNSSADE